MRAGFWQGVRGHHLPTLLLLGFGEETVLKLVVATSLYNFFFRVSLEMLYFRVSVEP